MQELNNKRHDTNNNELFTIKSIDKINSSIVITDDSNKIREIKIDMFQQLLYIAFCITVHKSQDSTFRHEYSIHEYEKFDEKLKYVALSRSSCINNINIC